MRDHDPITVTIIIPALNEEAHIGATLTALAGQVRDTVREILVADGGSTDATRAIVLEHGARDPRIRLVDNAKKLQSAGFNLAAKQSDPSNRYLIRADAHSYYGDDYVEALLRAARESGAESVVNRLRSAGDRCFQRAVGAASNSRMGTGGAIHRIGGASGFVNHGHHALFDRAWFLRLGGYDESFVANEDAEFDYRLRAAGGKIWYTDDATIGYVPRATPTALARQYYRYGYGRARNRMKHGERLQLRQLAPPAVVLAVAASLAVAPLVPIALLVPALYLLLVAAGAFQLAFQTRDRCALGAAIALPVMHFAWGIGFLRAQLSARAQGARSEAPHP